jgi:hypothetical protein
MARRAGSSRVTCESCLPIDIRDWRRRGFLRVGLEFPVFWNQAGKLCGYMSVHIEHKAAVLFFHSQFSGDIERRQIEQRVPIVWTACFLGGQRPWFQCTVYSGNQPAVAASRYFTALVTCSLVGTVTDWPMRARKRVRDFETLVGHGRSGCVSAAAQT